jgi:hypothetical protein
MAGASVFLCGRKHCGASTWNNCDLTACWHARACLFLLRTVRFARAARRMAITPARNGGARKAADERRGGLLFNAAAAYVTVALTCLTPRWRCCSILMRHSDHGMALVLAFVCAHFRTNGTRLL